MNVRAEMTYYNDLACLERTAAVRKVRDRVFAFSN